MLNPEDIIRMAREAGFVIDEKAKQHQPNCIFHTHHMVDELLERFARAAYERGRLDENEACAKVCEEQQVGFQSYFEVDEHIRGCAAAIRARRTSTISPATLIDPRGSLGEPIV
jgi:hypothetical protein